MPQNTAFMAITIRCTLIMGRNGSSALAAALGVAADGEHLLHRSSEALKCFHQLVDYGKTHLFDTMRIDYFAVSLPELQLFEENLTARNRLHCHFLIGLGCLDLDLTDRAEQELACVLQSDPAHTGAVWMTHPESMVLGL